MALITTLSGIPWYVHVGIGRTLLMFSRNKAGKKIPKNMEESFFFGTFKSILWKFLRPEFQRKHVQAFSWDTEKERGKFGVWNQPSFLFTNQLHSFSCLKQLSPAQHKLDVSNANRLDFKFTAICLTWCYIRIQEKYEMLTFFHQNWKRIMTFHLPSKIVTLQLTLKNLLNRNVMIELWRPPPCNIVSRIT